MPTEKRIVKQAASPRSVLTADGDVLAVPADWSLLAPGDATMTRRTKAAGPHWVVQEKKGRRTFSKGVWAPTTTISRVTAELEAERSTDAYAKKKKQAAVRRARKQDEYVDEFTSSVLSFLNFHRSHHELGEQLASAVSKHATPIGSGTVARTKRIPVERRAESAVIAWLRHQTTGYDTMKIARVKGKRREVRRQLAERSRQLLEIYRAGKHVDPEKCLLRKALTDN